jgi:hypothetical protein
MICLHLILVEKLIKINVRLQSIWKRVNGFRKHESIVGNVETQGDDLRTTGFVTLDITKFTLLGEKSRLF